MGNKNTLPTLHGYWRRKISKAFEEIYAGLNEAMNHAKGEQTKIIEHTAKSVNVKAIRVKTGMSQQRFCAAFGISLDLRRYTSLRQRIKHRIERTYII